MRSYVWGDKDFRVTSGYGPRSLDGFHYGLDLGMPTGTALYASNNGTLVTGFDTRGGNYVCIVFPDGSRDYYFHMSSFAVAGGVIKKGALIGYSGASGQVTGPHLHFERRLRNNDKNTTIDPSNYLTQSGGEDMFQEIPAKYSDGLPRDAKSWFNSYVNEYTYRQSLELAVKSKDEEIANLKNAINLKDEEIHNLKVALSSVEEQLNTVRASLDQQGKIIESQEKQIANLQAALSGSPTAPSNEQEKQAVNFVVAVINWLRNLVRG